MDGGGVRGGCCSVQGDSEGLAQGMVFPEGSERESHRNMRKEQLVQKRWGGLFKDSGASRKLEQRGVWGQAS